MKRSILVLLLVIGFLVSLAGGQWATRPSETEESHPLEDRQRPDIQPDHCNHLASLHHTRVALG
jgi:hypothetical protein